LYSIANIININDDNARASITLQMNKGKQKVIIDSNFVKIKSSKLIELGKFKYFGINQSKESKA